MTSQLISVREVADKFNCAVATVWRWSKELKGFPQPVRFGKRFTRWHLEEIEYYISNKVAGVEER